MAERMFGARDNYFQGEQVIGVSGLSYDNVAFAAGTYKIGQLPAGALITRTLVNITTAFGATTTAVLSVGTVSGTATSIVTAGDVVETVAALTTVAGVARAYGATTTSYPVYAKWAGAGAANTNGVVDIIVCYVSMNNIAS